MTKSILFICYYFMGRLRIFFFEMSPSHYKKFYLRSLIAKIKKRFLFYKKIKDFKCFDQIPIINKSIFLDSFSELNHFQLKYEDCLNRGLLQEKSRKFHAEPEGFSIGLSSGTSGKRGIFLTTEKEQIKWAANLFTHLSWFSFLRKYRIGFILRANSPMYEKVSHSKRIQFQFFDLMIPLNQLMIDFITYNPTVIVAPSYILQEILDYKKKFPDVLSNVQIIVSVADVLEVETENQLRLVFKCPIHQIYQATEGFLATTCAHEKLHLNEDLLFFEMENVDSDSHRITPIISDYFRETQAIVRYRLDDILIIDPTPCTCGGHAQVVNKIEGRSDEILNFNGIIIFPDYIRNAVQNVLPRSMDFCVYKKFNELVINLECSSIEYPLLEKKILENFHNLFTQFKIVNCNIKIEFNFQRDMATKRRRVFNLEHF